MAWTQGPAALTMALERLGYEVTDRPVPGAVRFEADREGFTLRADGAALEGEDALAGLALFEAGPRAVPAFRPGEDRGGTA